jgi:hypothetical protein
MILSRVFFIDCLRPAIETETAIDLLDKEWEKENGSFRKPGGNVFNRGGII